MFKWFWRCAGILVLSLGVQIQAGAGMLYPAWDSHLHYL